MAAVAALVLLFGCNTVDLSAVHTFAAQTAAAKQSFADLADDWLATCVRRTEYGLKKPSQLRHEPADPTPNGVDADSPCADAASLSQQWRARNDVVIAYVRALGALADVGSVPKNTDALAGGLSDIHLFPALKKAAFSDLVGKIASAAVAGQQRRAIGTFAIETDGALRTALGDLEFIADRYDEQLKNESSSLDQMFRDTLRAQTAGGSETLPEPPEFQARRLQIEAVRNEWESRRSELRQRHDKAAAYHDALETIRRAHGDIVARAHRFGPADLATVLKGYADSFGDDIATLAKPIKK